MNNQNISNIANCENTNDFNPFNSIDMENFIVKLKNEDQRYLQQVKSFKMIYLIFIFFYALIFAINFVATGSIERGISQLFYFMAFVIFYAIFRNLYKVYRDIDYSVSLSEMLTKVIDRYQLKAKYYFQIAIPIILIDIALVFSLYNRLTDLTPLNRILVVQSILTIVFGGAAYIGYLIWKKRQKPLVDSAKQMLSELNAC
ncbi:MAG TPA: hypothetical protein PL017_05395 [Tenuifilaceae bacterium]|nr:hypothetical protein [Tenuifilaceae bacterium]HPE19165.1 hypothetical protein [Tenuifilaceae bacterium]HPJ45512.1 hypothetical protein [Tenuifilaceae bacterium]HPQ33834.1 hypothetical protein [Tenuifilaceae bacterium]HRX68203.1 hypothetical protein [Tenuifilaceae bacterium]